MLYGRDGIGENVVTGINILSWPSLTSAEWVPLTQENRILDIEV